MRPNLSLQGLDSVVLMPTCAASAATIPQVEMLACRVIGQPGGWGYSVLLVVAQIAHP
ncbi:MAG: hypothetical protein JSS44_01670 [Proteobacteria bacterium]|nr:hypothetical protein [Pseudomonadota bacterium]MBS0462969.1 hypothetical protein [Pseudomonadota bacterium]MBS0463905.1 hypothetical protein [Pseudomonadota bacterium]